MVFLRGFLVKQSSVWRSSRPPRSRSSSGPRSRYTSAIFARIPRRQARSAGVRACTCPRLGCSVLCRCCPARHCVPATSPGPVRSLEPVVADVHGESPDGRSRNGDGSHTRLGCDPRPVGILPALGTRLTEPFSPFKRVRSHKPTPCASALPAPSNAVLHPA